MPAKSKAQQKAAGAALSAKHVTGGLLLQETDLSEDDVDSDDLDVDVDTRRPRLDLRSPRRVPFLFRDFRLVLVQTPQETVRDRGAVFLGKLQCPVQDFFDSVHDVSLLSE
jgi:hypothetical protein